ncbi:MAG: hypothetical protein GXX95_00895 [Methanomassiliicoccus sp.]|nr:hypothetical protein [Methanomassiliicoccus sp.]
MDDTEAHRDELEGGILAASKVLMFSAPNTGSYRAALRKLKDLIMKLDLMEPAK